MECDPKGWPSPTHLTEELFVQVGGVRFDCKVCKTGTAGCSIPDMAKFRGLMVLHNLGESIARLVNECALLEFWEWEDAEKRAYVVTLNNPHKASDGGATFVQATTLGDSFEVELDGFDSIASVASKIQACKQLPLMAEIHFVNENGSQLTERQLQSLRPEAEIRSVGPSGSGD